MNRTTPNRPRLIVAITGASGSIYGVRMLEQLRKSNVFETHLIISSSGALTARLELDLTRQAIEDMADVVHNVKDIGASISSGSFKSVGMIIAPCSMKSVAAIAHGLADNLITRCADVILKERRKLILLARETPLNLAHLRNMTLITEMGGIISPPVPAFYTKPQNLDDVVNHTVGRVLDIFEVEHAGLVKRWTGTGSGMAKKRPTKTASVALTKA